MPVGQCLEGMWPSPFGVAKQLDLDFNCPYRKSPPRVPAACGPAGALARPAPFLLVETWNDGWAARSASIPTTSSRPSPEAWSLLVTARADWGIGNSLYWILDMVFREDESRVRQGHVLRNLCPLRCMALNLLRQDTIFQAGVAIRCRKVGCKLAYMETVLGLASSCECPANLE